MVPTHVCVDGSSFWHIYNVGCWCSFFRTIKVAHGVGGQRMPRHPRILAVHQTARMSCKAVCTTDGWSVEMNSYFSRMEPSLCPITIPTWEQGCVFFVVCAYLVVAEVECAAGTFFFKQISFSWSVCLDGALQNIHIYRRTEHDWAEHVWDVRGSWWGWNMEIKATLMP